MEQRSKPSIWAYLLIFIGLVFLLNNFGWLPWESWAIIWRFWPFILIFIGLQMILGRSRVGVVVSSIISLLLIAVVLLVLAASSNSDLNNYLKERISWWDNVFLVARQETKEQQIVVKDDEYDGVVSRQLKAELGVADFSLVDDDSTNFISILSKYYDNYETPILEKELENDQLNFLFKTKTKAHFYPGFFRGTSHRITLGQSSLRSDIDISVGTGKADIDLTKIGIDDFKVDVGTGLAEIDLGKAALPTKFFDLSVGTGKISLVLPADIGLKIDHSIGLGKATISGAELKDDDTYTSKNYETAVIKLTIKVSVGTGQIEISQR